MGSPPSCSTSASLGCRRSSLYPPRMPYHSLMARKNMEIRKQSWAAEYPPAYTVGQKALGTGLGITYTNVQQQCLAPEGKRKCSLVIKEPTGGWMPRNRQSLGVWLQGLKARGRDEGSGVTSPEGRYGCNAPVKPGDSSSTTRALPTAVGSSSNRNMVRGSQLDI